MIQAPQVQYMPIQQVPATGGQPTGAVNTIQNQQTPATPGVFYNYPTASSYMPANSYSTDKAQYNGVNIEVINPQGMAVPNQMPAQFYPVQQPVYMTPYQAPVQQAPAQAPVAEPAAPVTAPVSTATVEAPQTQSAVEQPVQAPAQQEVPQPQIQTPQAADATAPAQAPVVNEPVAASTTISPETFAGRLKTDNLDDQQKALEEIAQLVKDDENAGPALLDTQIFDGLTEILNKDTSSLEGPSQEVIDLRQKPESERTPEENEKANTASPLEKAEANKQYALYTMSYMQDRLNSELEKRGGKALELNELPCINNVIDAAKSNPDPMVRAGAVASLSHIARPEYKQDLATIFDLAKADEDPQVKDAANKASEALNVK